MTPGHFEKKVHLKRTHSPCRSIGLLVATLYPPQSITSANSRRHSMLASRQPPKLSIHPESTIRKVIVLRGLFQCRLIVVCRPRVFGRLWRRKVVRCLLSPTCSRWPSQAHIHTESRPTPRVQQKILSSQLGAQHLSHPNMISKASVRATQPAIMCPGPSNRTNTMYS